MFWPLLRASNGGGWASDVKGVMYLGMTVHPRDAASDVLVPMGEATRDQLPRGHLYAARIEPVGVSDIDACERRPIWQGEWWHGPQKRTRQEFQEAERSNGGQAVTRRFRRRV